MQQKLATGVSGAKAWLKQAETVLANHSDRLDAINVFPVPDGDTGTNLYETVKVASQAAQAVETDSDLGLVLSAAAQAALEDARGNSGTLLSVFLVGFAEPLQGQARLNLTLLAESLDRGQLRSWSALTDPVPGTMPTAMTAASRAVFSALQEAEASAEPHSRAALLHGLDAAIDATRTAVVQSEAQIDSLAAARVVDSGAVGFLLVLEAMKAAVAGSEVGEEVLDGFPGYGIQDPHVHRSVPVEEGVEVMCSMSLSPLDAALLRARLDDVGESVIISALPGGEEDEARWRIHVHVPEEETTLEMLKTFGEPENVSVTALSTSDSCA
ncbi:DAK2 domain-containing protein [Zhihengliuella salsuginis]|uniref:DhaL domain-containing protein n=1 Tax=Zhihengliuella salsuginis TaxID=578222 RepID=A0ABQ3GLH6_9MICC|nr:DAK2 domain-containing protein [Zhihengliuella salsuginis]GHD11686.1 hypothetical protein GCM10008096_26350 [Zhihengliuella salsuginis]